MTLENSGKLSVAGGSEALRDWSFSVTPDNAPTISFHKDPARAANGAMTVEYNAQDDYRVAKARGIIELAEAPKPGAIRSTRRPTCRCRLPRRSAEDGAAKTTRDLGEHPGRARR